MRRKLVIPFGLTGIGKGTACKNAVGILEGHGINFRHVSTGQILRERQQHDGLLATRKLVYDDVVKEIVVEELNVGENWFLDGFPRNVEQAKFIDEFAKTRRLAISLVYLAAGEKATEVATNRIVNRAKVEGRTIDATPEAITEGFQTFHKYTVPAYRYLKKRWSTEMLIEASKPPMQVADDLVHFVMGSSYRKVSNASLSLPQMA